MAPVLYFPQRRICALGVPGDAVDAVREAMPYVAVSTDGEALQRCDLVVLDAHDRGAGELVQWIHGRQPDFPVVLWDAAEATTFVERCRRLLFPTGTSSLALRLQ